MPGCTGHLKHPNVRIGRPMSDQPRNPLSQILVAVVIALAVGGSAPWWWVELKGLFGRQQGAQEQQEQGTQAQHQQGAQEQPRPRPHTYNQAAYDSVQALYVKHKAASACGEIRHLVSGIEAYLGNRDLVPPDAIYTVRNPTLVRAPTISDLATDRIIRIKSVRTDCFT